MPEEHPWPPEDFSSRALPITEISGSLWRISRAKYANPLHFGSAGTCRFDSPDQSYGVCYFARDLAGAFIEVFGRSIGVNLVTMKALESRVAIESYLSQPLTAVDLTGAGLVKIGADTRLTGGGDYNYSHAWSAAIHKHPALPHGILHRSRHDPARICFAAFDRSASLIKVRNIVLLTSNSLRAEMGSVISHYGFAIG